jgi:hypothetical protein
MIGRPIIGRALVAALALVVTAAFTAACASQHTTPPRSSAVGSPIASYETETATPAPPTGAEPVPPETPCIYPADEPSSPAAWDPGFAGLLQESDLVVEADIEDKFQRSSQVGDQVYWSQLIDNVDVLRSRAVPAPTVLGLDAQGDPGKPPYGWPPGRYLLLLVAPESGVSYASNGMSGMFRIVDGKALRYCPNYQDPAHPIAASGTPPTVDELLALIPPELPPDIVSPKPGAATVSPAVSGS